MSARGSHSNRPDLFSARNENTKNDVNYDTDSRLDSYSKTENDDPLQLEHMLGFSGNHKSTLCAVPFNENMYIKR
jgi:hypothetical protein